MIGTLVFAFAFSFSVTCLVMPKAAGFVWKELKGLFTKGDHPRTLLVFVLLTQLGLGVAAFIGYKLTTSVGAYFLANDVIEHFILSRGVFSIESGAQFALQPKNMLVFISIVLVKILSCAYIYNATGYSLKALQVKYRSARGFTLGSQILLSLGSILVFLVLEVMFLAQDIATVSKYSNLTLLTLANLSLIAFFVCIIHIRYKRDHPEYFVDLQTYVNVERPLMRMLRHDGFSLLGALIFGLCLHLPHYLGLQFLEDNVVLLLLMLAIVLMSILLVFRKFFIRFFDVMTRVFLLPHFGSEPLTTNRRWQMHHRLILGLLVATVMVILLRLPSLLSFVVLGSMLGLGALFTLSLILGLLLHLVLALPGIGKRSLTNSTFTNELLDPHNRPDIMWHLKLTERTFSPSYLPLLALILLLVAMPKKYPASTENYSQTVFDRDSVMLYQAKNAEGFRSVPVSLSSVPHHFLEVLTWQEDRGLLRQCGWLPNRHNWFGISTTSLLRFVTRQGGGSNITNQLCKNEAFRGRRVQDVQRKFFELIASFQISLSTTPEEQLEHYLGRVPMFGGKGHKGLFMAAREAFGLRPSQLSELQSLLLVRSLQYGHRFPLLSGRKASYDSLHLMGEEVRETLLARYAYWKDRGLIEDQRFLALVDQPLFEKGKERDTPLVASSREVLRKRLPASSVIATSTMSRQGQELVQSAHRRFQYRMRRHTKKGPYTLRSAALAVDCPSGEIIGHYGGGGVSDLTNFGAGYQVGSIMKPFILMEMLEGGIEPSALKLYDGAKNGRPTVQNFSRRYSNQYVGLEEMLAKSLNAPFHNISEMTPAIELFQQVENRFGRLGIVADRSIDLADSLSTQSYLQNYPLGLRRMTLWDVARAYQPLFNEGLRKSIHLYRDVDGLASSVYSTDVCDRIKSALAATVEPGGTGTHFVSLLPSSKRFYAKTGTSDDAIHGWTVLSDGQLLIVAFVTYAAEINGRLELNQTPSIPTGSGAQTAGVLAALMYESLTSPANRKPNMHLLAMSR